MSCNCGENNCNKNSRRDFLRLGLLATAAAAGCTDNHPFVPEESVALTGEKVKLLSVNGEVIEIDKAYLKPAPDLPKISNTEERRGIPGKKFVMVIDLARCKNLRNARVPVTTCTRYTRDKTG